MTCRDPKPMLITTFLERRVVCASCNYLVEVDSFPALLEARDAHLGTIPPDPRYPESVGGGEPRS